LEFVSVHFGLEEILVNRVWTLDKLLLYDRGVKTERSNSMDTIRIRDLEFVVAQEVSQRQIMDELASKYHWAPLETFRTGEMITGKIVEKDWWFEPISDYCTLPTQAQARINLILKSIKPEGIILAHEIVVEPKVDPQPWVLPPEKPKPLPWVLPPEKPQPQRSYPLRPQPEPWKAPEIDIDWERVKETAGQTAKVAGVVLGVAGLAMVATLGIMATALCGIDPLVLIVTKGTKEWTIIYRYSE
jgi:hypothetical protein